MLYLDATRLPQILDTEYADSRSDRMAGVTHRSDSGYLDIIRFQGPGAVDSADIAVTCEPETYRVTDPLVVRFAAEIEGRMRKEGRLHDGPLSMKLKSADLTGARPIIRVQPVSYGLQAATCFALDLPHPLFADYGGTLRDYWYQTRMSRAIVDNPLAICLGVCGYLMIEEAGRRYVLQVHRSRRLASLEASLGPSVAGVVDYAETAANLHKLLSSALEQEAIEETGLTPDEYEIIPLAWATEIFRGERPQLFALLRARLDRAQMGKRLDAIPQRHREFSDYDFEELADGVALRDDLFAALNPEARMAGALLEEYLSASSAK